MARTVYQYKEVPFSMASDLILQINEEGEHGWKFHSMAQRMTGKKDLMTGGPKFDLVLLFERSFIMIEEKQKDA